MQRVLRGCSRSFRARHVTAVFATEHGGVDALTSEVAYFGQSLCSVLPAGGIAPVCRFAALIV
jgi:hypothetical protein